MAFRKVKTDMSQEKVLMVAISQVRYTWAQIYRFRCVNCMQRPTWDLNKSMDLEPDEIYLMCGCKGKHKVVKFVPGSPLPKIVTINIFPSPRRSG